MVCLNVYLCVYAVMFRSHLCKRHLLARQNILSKLQHKQIPVRVKKQTTEWEAGAQHEHKSIDVSQALPHLWHIICFNKSLSVWPWFESAHSSKVISPTSPFGPPHRAPERSVCVCVCVCVRVHVCVCVCALLVRVLPCKFLAQVIWLRGVKFHSEEESVRRPVCKEQRRQEEVEREEVALYWKCIRSNQIKTHNWFKTTWYKSITVSLTLV